MTGVPPGYDDAVPPRWPGAPPSAAYLAERERLGFPSRALALSRACPWCGAGPYQECIVMATGRRLTRAHEAREVPVVDGVLEETAASQP
jgi:pyruvate/2-oxoacid:ferredoxin oxidoreductase beta subunit